MTGHSNILARMRRRKARGALCAAALLLAAQLSAALTPCLASAADGVAHAARGVSAETPHGNHASRDARDFDHANHADHAGHGDHDGHADHVNHVDHALTAHAVVVATHSSDVGHAAHAPIPDDRQHCPHCAGVAPDGGVTQAGQSHACTAVETVDTAPQPSLELAAKVLHSAVIPVVVHPPAHAAARASPRHAAPPVPSAVPLNVRHCVFLI